MHLLLKASRAKGPWSLLRQERAVEEVVYRIAKRYRVRIFRFANVGNHLHLGVQTASRREFQAFLRVLPQALAFLLTGTRKGRPIGRFWDFLAFTRVVQWGKDWFWMKNYIEKNRLEAEGQPRDLLDFQFKELWNSS